MPFPNNTRAGQSRFVAAAAHLHMQALPLPDLVHQLLRRVLAEKDNHVVMKIGPISCTIQLQASKNTARGQK
jgi:hypothetical protein